MCHCIGCKEGTRGKRGVLELQDRDDALLHAIGRLLGQDEFGTAKNMCAAPGCLGRNLFGSRRERRADAEIRAWSGSCVPVGSGT